MRAFPLRDSDLLVTLFTPDLGLVEALAPSARRSTTRLQGLEALHRLRVALEVTPRGGRLVESSIEQARLGILGSLDATLAGGTALRWVRAALPLGLVDPEVWRLTNALLDELELCAMGGAPPACVLGARGLALLASFGWGFELGACVRCGKGAPAGASAYFDFDAGGLVCRACGGGSELLRGEDLAALGQAQLGAPSELSREAAARALGWVERALARHAPSHPRHPTSRGD